MLRIVVDGSADMPQGWLEKYQFDILPIPIQIGGKTYYQGVDLTPELFYNLISNPENRPQTAAPSPTMIQNFLENLGDLGDTILSINVGEALSATVNMVKQAAGSLKGKLNILAFDSGAGSAVLAFMAREARRREKAGESIEKIIESLQAIREKCLVVLTVDNLEFARRSGRVGALKAALTSLLNIKPIITLQEGLMNVTGLVRTRQRSLDQLVSKVKERFGNEPVRVAVVHAQDPSTAEILKQMLEKVLNLSEILMTELSISVAANLGPKTVGIVALPMKLEGI
jgi:DegV family protein with EDD domain